VIGSARVRIEGSSGEILGAGELGEIVGTGPELFAGYVDSAADAAAFTPDGWYKTGDLGWLDDYGFLTVSGRLGDLIIRGGENISPSEVELVLEAQAGVQEAVVVGLPDQILGERVHAVVVASREFDPDECRRALLGSEMARHKVPDVIVVWDSIPHTASGKVQRAAVRSALDERARSRP
jgi:fatty-acyl-CoA synthase